MIFSATLAGVEYKCGELHIRRSRNTLVYERGVDCVRSLSTGFALRDERLANEAPKGSSTQRSTGKCAITHSAVLYMFIPDRAGTPEHASDVQPGGSLRVKYYVHSFLIQAVRPAINYIKR